MNGNFVGVWLQIAMQHRRKVLAGILSIITLFAAGLAQLSQSNDYRVYFAENDPLLTASENLQDVYSRSDNLLFVLAPENGDVFTRENLAAVQWLTEAAWQLPFSTRVDSITNFQHSRAKDDTLIIENLVSDPAELSDAALVRVREVALQEPLLVNRLVAPTGKVTGINVTVTLPNKNADQEVPEVMAAARKLAEQLRVEFPRIKAYLTGVVPMNNAFPEASERDMGVLIPALFGLVIVGLFLLFREWQAAVSSVIILLLSILAAMGMAGWLGIQLSPASAAAPLIILTVAVADCVHILVNYQQSRCRTSQERGQALIESVCINLRPIFLTSLTTAVGFLSMNLSDSPPFHDLGNISAIGVGVAFLLSITLLPVLMALFPDRRKPSKDLDRNYSIAIANFVIRRQASLLWGGAAAMLVLGVFLVQNELDDQFVEYFDEAMVIREATDFTTEHLTGVNLIEYSVPAGELESVSDPAYLQNLEDFVDWYRKQPETLHVYAITDIMKRLNRNMHDDAVDWYRLPDDRETAAQYLFLYEMSLPYGLDLNDRINLDKSASRVTVLLDDLSTRELLAVEERAQAWLDTHVPQSMRTDGVGWSIMFGHIAINNIVSMLQGTTLAMVLISGVLVLAFRSLKIGLLSLLPNVLPAAMAFAVWGMLVGQIGVAASIIAAMTLGIVVDDTVHFVTKYLRARQIDNLEPDDAVRFAFNSVGVAIVFTSIVLFFGFLVLSFSSFKVNAEMGLLVAITVVFALLLDFLLLPALLMKVDKRKARIAPVAHPA